MKKFSLAIEKVFRFFNISNDFNYKCVVVQIAIKKELIKNDIYFFKIENLQKLLFKVELLINPIKNSIIEIGAHEDPLIETDNFYLICLQIPMNIIPLLCKNVLITFSNENKIIEKKIFNNLNNLLDVYSEKVSYLVDEFNIVSLKKCKLTIHLGDSNGKYKEDNFILNKNIIFNFKNYVKKYSYVGVQCSYENNKIELEEKYILIGQKGMTETHMFFDGKEYHYSLLPFKKTYQKLFYMDSKPEDYLDYINIRKKVGLKINTIEEILSFIKNKKFKLMEININFIINQYKNFNTYGLKNIYTSNKIKEKFHIDLDVCKNCNYNTKCMQIIPSGLSYDLYKKNIVLEDEKKCSIYKIIKKNINI